MAQPMAQPEPAAGRVRVPVGPRPDLRALPAWGIMVTGPDEADEGGGQQLAFSATVWNAGPSPLVVEGFRRSGTNLMDLPVLLRP